VNKNNEDEKAKEEPWEGISERKKRQHKTAEVDSKNIEDEISSRINYLPDKSISKKIPLIIKLKRWDEWRAKGWNSLKLNWLVQNEWKLHA